MSPDDCLHKNPNAAMPTTAYTPQPGTIPAKVIAHLQQLKLQGRDPWVPLAELEAAVGQSSLSAFLVAPIKHGALRKREMPHNRRLSEYALGDGKPLPKPEDHEADEPLHNTEPAAAVKPSAAPWPPAVPIKTRDATVATRKRPGGPAQYADIDSMQITDDPITGRTNTGGDKYSVIFAQMKLGQSIKCQPADAPRVANALRKWAGEHHPGSKVRSVRHYPKDSLGRVWLLAGAGKGKRA